MTKITRFDVFFKLVELRNKTYSSISILELTKSLNSSKKSIYNQLKLLVKAGLVIKTENYLPKVDYNEDSLYSSLMNIFDFSRRNKVNYNLLLNKNFFKIVGSKKKVITIADIKNLHYETFKKYLALMLKLSFAMVLRQKPLEIRVLNHPLLKYIFTVNSCEYVETIRYFNSKDEEYYLRSIADMSEKINLKLAKFKKANKKQRILFIAHTTQLEGNPMQFTEVKELIETKNSSHENKNAIRENKNIDDALNLMTQFKDRDMTMETINKIHYQVQKFIGKGDITWKQIAGKVRNVQVKISNNPNFQISAPEKLKEKLEGFISTFNKELKLIKNLKKTPLNLKRKIQFATWAHSEFQHIHPYIDGNSRTTRILFNYVLIEFGLPLTDIYFVKEYLDVTKGEKKRDDEKLCSFFIHLIYDNMLRLVSESEVEESKTKNTPQ